MTAAAMLALTAIGMIPGATGDVPTTYAPAVESPSPRVAHAVAAFRRNGPARTPARPLLGWSPWRCSGVPRVMTCTASCTTPRLAAVVRYRAERRQSMVVVDVGPNRTGAR